MDSAANNESPVVLNPQSQCEVASVGQKRPVENGDAEELGVRSAKKLNCGTGEMRRVAEIVLVLSTMAGMRGGRSPTEAELNLMAEARAKLVEICQYLAPKDLVVRDTIGTVIEDLGLNWKLKDQRLGFRGSRLSIKEKVSLTKRKVEETKKFTAPSATYTSQMSQPSFGAISEIRGLSHSIRMFPSDKPSNPPLPSGGLPSSSALGHVSAANSTSVTPQPLNTDVRTSTVSTAMTNIHLGTGPGVDKTHFKLGGGSNGTNYAPQMQANASGNQPSVNAPTWSLQSHSISSVKTTLENKVLNHNAGKAEGATDLGLSRAAPQAARDQAFIPFIAQSASTNLPSAHQPMQGVKYVQTSPFFNNHNEISKIVQKLLLPKLPEHPTWTPPSREYMNKPLTCQVCQVTINEVETAVVCDACEKGFHLKCLESLNQKGIPRGGEWHCLRCTTLSNGKPLPPKYGRVMRSITPLKGPSNPPGAQPSSEKKNETVDLKVNQKNLTAKGRSGLQESAARGTVSSNGAEPASDLKVLNARETTANSITPTVEVTDHGSSCGNIPDNLTKSLDVVSDSPSVGISSESSIRLTQVSESHTWEEISVSEPKLQLPPILSEIISDKLENSKSSTNLHDIGQTEPSNACEVPLEANRDNSKGEDSENIGHSDMTARSDVRQSAHHVTDVNPFGSSEANEEAKNLAGMSSAGLHCVEWNGNVLKVADGKKFYESCSINGITYKVQDHALFCTSNKKLMPSKLQAMWEDFETGSKWVIASQCYFPADLPEDVGHPCAPESNEVYESNHEDSLMASLIQGPCEVLPPTKFLENSKIQSQLGIEGNNESRPVFLCKWFYDELKGNFQPVVG